MPFNRFTSYVLILKFYCSLRRRLSSFIHVVLELDYALFIVAVS